MSDIEEKNPIGFTVLKMNVQDEDDSANVIFMGHWMVDGLTRPDSSPTEGTRYAVALTPSNSYFVFHEQFSTPELRSYDVYDDFEGMEASRDVPQEILDAVSSALVPGPVNEDEVTEA